jgi:hypothetical protein
MSWDDLCGNRVLRAIRMDVRHPFDANAAGVALDLDEVTVFVFEDPNDGYRSSAAEPMIVKAPLYSFGCYPEYIRAPVLVKRWTVSECGGDGADGVEFIDTRNGKTILLLGTDNIDDYYPSYTCDWRPQNLAENAAA